MPAKKRKITEFALDREGGDNAVTVKVELASFNRSEKPEPAFPKVTRTGEPTERDRAFQRFFTQARDEAIERLRDKGIPTHGKRKAR